MGYRSEVAFVIEFDTPENAQNYFAKFKSIEEIKWALPLFTQEDDEKYIKFYSDWIKWYEDYEDIRILTEMWHDSIEAEGFVGYAFKRIGEYIEDVEEVYEGDNAYEYINTVRRLELCV